MANEEIYVRGTEDTEARGPFTLEQLISLTESNDPGKGVTLETYYYDAGTEQWILIGDSPEMKAALWPEKKRLAFKQKEFNVINEEQVVDEKGISVEDFLAAAEGQTEDTKGKKDKNITMLNAAIWGTRSAAIISLLSAAALILPSIDALTSMDLAKMLDRPFIFLGLIDAFIGLLLLLGVINIYPFVRFRAVFGLGFLGFLFMTQGQLTPMLAVAAGSAGLYFCTIFLSYIPLAVAILLGVGGMAMLATISYS